jgi:hypothetical protein
LNWESEVESREDGNMDKNFKSIKSPLQMAGFYLAWVETVLAASFWPLKGQGVLVNILLYVVVGIAVVFAVALVFILIYMVVREPRWLFNPSDYDPSVQNRLFRHDYSSSEAQKVKLEPKATEAGGQR